MQEKIKLHRLIDWSPRSNFKASEGLENGIIPFYTSSQLQTKWCEEAIYHNESIILGTGGNPNIHYSTSPFTTSADCLVARAKLPANIINLKFVFYYLKGNKSILERGFRGVAIRHITKSYIENIELEIPSIGDQNRIVTILDKIELIIENKNNFINELDILALSYYQNLFGPKSPNYTNWPEVTLDDYKKGSKAIRTGPFGSALTHDTFTEDGDVAVLGIDNAVDNTFQWKKKRFISISDFEALKNYQVYANDVLVTIMGTVGRSAVVPENIGLAINTKHLVAITLDEGKCNPYYLSYSIHSNPYISHQIRARSRGAVMDGLNLSLLKQLKIKNAPINLQNEFATKYRMIVSIRSKVLDSLQLSENLLGSLIKEYLSPRSSIDFDIQLETIINAIDLKLPTEDNKIDIVKSDIAFRQKLFDRLTTQEFENLQQYDKAKYIAFRIFKENVDKIQQEFDDIKKEVNLIIG